MHASLLAHALIDAHQLHEHDRWSRRELERHQAGALRELRDFAVASSPFYRDLHRGLESRPLHELPVVTKSALMANLDHASTAPAVRLEALESHLAGETVAAPLGNYQVAATSGTTGVRGLFAWDPEEWATVLASYARAQAWAGLAPSLLRRTSMAVVSSRTPWHQSAVVAATADSPFLPTLRLDAADPIADTVAKLNEYQPAVLVAYASIARVLAHEQLAGRLKIAPRAVMCASEALSPGSREIVQRAFSIEPFDVYAATETAGIASQCERHSMHLYEDLVITEVVDEHDHPVPIGTFGAKVLVTVLFSRTLPLIRYEMSDRVALQAGDCSCGRPYARVLGILGRTEDTLELPGEGGTTVSIHPNLFHDALDALPLRGWQVVEEELSIRVRVAADAADAVPDDLAERIRRALRARGAVADVVVDRVADVERTRAGKALVVRREGRASGTGEPTR